MAFCVNCGAKIEGNTAFCPACGQPVGGTVQTAASAGPALGVAGGAGNLIMAQYMAAQNTLKKVQDEVQQWKSAVKGFKIATIVLAVVAAVCVLRAVMDQINDVFFSIWGSVAAMAVIIFLSVLITFLVVKAGCNSRKKNMQQAQADCNALEAQLKQFGQQ